MAEYKGRKFTLNKPRRIGRGEPSYGKKKSVVYVKDGDKVKRVTFGDPNMKIKKNQKSKQQNHKRLNLRYRKPIVVKQSLKQLHKRRHLKILR